MSEFAVADGKFTIIILNLSARHRNERQHKDQRVALERVGKLRLLS